MYSCTRVYYSNQVFSWASNVNIACFFFVLVPEVFDAGIENLRLMEPLWQKGLGQPMRAFRESKSNWLEGPFFSRPPFRRASFGWLAPFRKIRTRSGRRAMAQPGKFIFDGRHSWDTSICFRRLETSPNPCAFFLGGIQWIHLCDWDAPQWIVNIFVKRESHHQDLDNLASIVVAFNPSRAARFV